MTAGPKTGASFKPLVERDLAGLRGAARVAGWVEKFVVVPKGVGAKGSLKLRLWQVDLISQCFDDPRPRIAMWSLPRGQGKSTLAAALGLYGLFGDGVEGASVCIVAKDERQARIIFAPPAGWWPSTRFWRSGPTSTRTGSRSRRPARLCRCSRLRPTGLKVWTPR